MARYFTVDEAERQLPQVEAALRDAMFQRDEAKKAQEQLEAITARIRLAGGARVNPGELLRLRSARDLAALGMRGALEKIERLGAQLKDLDIGLIDFLCHYEGREVCLCWKMGENGITHWHATDEGFRGRKPIDSTFLRSHRGDSPSDVN